MNPIPDLYSYTHALASYPCGCGLRLVLAVHREAKQTTARTLRQAAYTERWRLVAGEWHCPACYGSKVLDAVMRAKVGDRTMRLLVDQAEDQRAAELRIEVIG